MQKPTVIVSGKNGQLGKELQFAAEAYPQLSFIFLGREELDISDTDAVAAVFKRYRPVFFINTAAYTAVDKAETDQVNAYMINAEATGTIAMICSRYQTKLIHLSTDYVFDGNGSNPYKEDDIANPVNYYGFTKWTGEQLALKNNAGTIVIRTSWVYSIYGNNFVKTMLRLMKEREEISVVNDQSGSPTYAKDLAEVILQIVNAGQNTSNGIYHFSNDGIISWYEFAQAIRNIKQLDCKIHPVTTAQFKTAAKRPGYSVMDKQKIQSVLNITLKDWKESLKECLDKL